jgi:hypothetical protein
MTNFLTGFDFLDIVDAKTAGHGTGKFDSYKTNFG